MEEAKDESESERRVEMREEREEGGVLVGAVITYYPQSQKRSEGKK